eukprot:1062883-Pelagomonas_calceolata.AAC.1
MDVIGKKHPSPSPPTPPPSGCDSDPYAAILPCSTSLGGSLVLLVSLILYLSLLQWLLGLCHDHV